MSALIPDNILTTLICSKCRKYLSVNPVKVYPNRQILCGRCSSPGDNGRVSFYQNVLRKGLFRCINRYEGCNKALTAASMFLHEKECAGGQYTCLVCDANEGTAFELVSHFTLEHKHSVITHPVIFFRLCEDVKKYFLYVKEDFVFVINVEVDTAKKVVMLSSVNVGPKTRAESIKYKFSIYKDDVLVCNSESLNCGLLFTQYNCYSVSFSELNVSDKEFVNCWFEADISEVQTFLSIPANVPIEKVSREPLLSTSQTETVTLPKPTIFNFSTEPKTNATFTFSNNKPEGILSTVKRHQSGLRRLPF